MNKPNRILVVDDEEPIRKGLAQVISDLGYQAETAADAERALELILASPPDLVITDLNLPGMGGMELIARLQELGIETTLAVLTGHGSIESAVEATKRGVYDYITKPIDLHHLTTLIRRGLERSRLRREVLGLRREMAQDGRFQELVGKSPRMGEIYRLVEQVAFSDASVFITGESGTGKEIIARTIHGLSPRAQERLVAVNCAAIPENLLESEMFGHEKGAFTGATNARPGCFELADGGTLFLDEIGQMPIELQSKLLRVLEDGMVRRVGGAKEVKVDARVLSAANTPVEELLSGGRLREDLYYRLNVFTIEMPPLRERREDIPLLANHFLAGFAETNGRRIAEFSEDALAMMVGHDWPGNVRELRNAVQRSVILCSEGEIQARHLPASVRGKPGPPASAGGAEAKVEIPIGTSIESAEKTLILETLSACEGNKTKTAGLLGISVKTLYSKLHRYGQKIGSKEGA
jgi:DNA-binding NtrC family response regulator